MDLSVGGDHLLTCGAVWIVRTHATVQGLADREEDIATGHFILCGVIREHTVQFVWNPYGPVL